MSDDAIGMRTQVVHQHAGRGDRVCGGRDLFGCYFVEGWEDTGVTGAAMAHEGCTDGLDSGDPLLIERLGLVLRCRALRLA
jgi:hypothetical protein